MRDRETFRVQPSEFRTGGPEVDYDVEVWNCECREWPIVVATTTYSDNEDWPKREVWHVRKCGLCRRMPGPR